MGKKIVLLLTILFAMPTAADIYNNSTTAMWFSTQKINKQLINIE